MRSDYLGFVTQLQREHGLTVSLRTIERAVSHLRREVLAQTAATVRFETPPGQQLQIDFGTVRVPVGDEQTKVHLFVATGSVRLGDDRLTPVSMVDAYGRGRQPGGWYDEMLIDGDTVVVIGYSYAAQASEVGLFDINAEGQLRWRDTVFVRSSDYYSSRNYASRLIGRKLIFYSPTMLQAYGPPPLQMMPGVRLTVGSHLYPQVREYTRTSTAVVNAYLAPVMRRYVTAVDAYFRSLGAKQPVRYFQSNGGLAIGQAMTDRSVYAINSGPASAPQAGLYVSAPFKKKNVITVDMGGTSLDVCLIEGGRAAMSRTSPCSASGASLSARASPLSKTRSSGPRIPSGVPPGPRSSTSTTM